VLFHEAKLPPEAKAWDELYVVPLQDLHIGDPRFREDVFQAIKAWLLEAPNRFAILNGDLFNTALKHSVSSVYEDTMNPREQLRYGRKLFDGLQGRVLSATTGNHEERITRETSIDIMEEFAAWLGCVYDPAGVCLKLKFGKDSRHSNPMVYALYHTHGASGAQFIGGKALSMERIAQSLPLADVVVTGHTHAKIAFKDRVLVPDLRWNKLEYHERTYVNGSTLLDWGGYAERKGYRPSALGPAHIRLSGKRKEVTVTI
jgi:hypothetical protein